MFYKFQIIRIFIVFFIFITNTNAENIAYIDMEFILKNSKLGMSINKQIKKKKRNRSKKFKINGRGY